ncbi:transposable element Tc1 transposase [Trichonephila clavipes]|nr:transposable element Tc1 transposase [Trichonephila clavipes]
MPDHRDENCRLVDAPCCCQVDLWECAVSNCWEQWKQEGTHTRKTGSAATRKITRRDDQRIIRRPGERYNCPHTVLRQTARTAVVIVWGCIAYDSRSTLIVTSGTLTRQRYVDDILRPHVGHFLNGLPGAIFKQDNARSHTARVAQDFLRHFQTTPWPARSPDLSPVEHVWEQLKRQMSSCQSVHDLELVVQDLWAHVPQDYIRCLMKSMLDHVAACIAAGGGGPTRY